MATSDSKAPLRTVKRVQFGILSPDEIVSGLYAARGTRGNAKFYEGHIFIVTIQNSPSLQPYAMQIIIRLSLFFAGLKYKYEIDIIVPVY